MMQQQQTALERDFYSGQSTAEYVRRHDLYYGAPINDPMVGMPIGDGDTGTLLWQEANGLRLHVNKCDLWDLALDEDDCFCSSREEDLTCLRHGGELTVSLASPVFDMLYQQQHESRLSLGDATAGIYAKTPFGTVRARAFACARQRVSVLQLQYDAAEPEGVEIGLSRFGSRNFWRWYAQTRPDARAGLDGTRASCDGRLLYVVQRLRGTVFCLGALVCTQGEYESVQKNSRSVSLRLAPSRQVRFTVYYHISVAQSEEEAERACREALRKAEACGARAMHEQHTRQWADFWNRSRLHVADDFLENLWYLSLYYANSQCRGAYPPHFTVGLWGFRHDFVPWTYYFHYNMQHMYAPLEAAGHGELAEGYYAMRRRALPAACRYAERVKKKKGAFYHDVTDLFGRGANYDSHNCTPGAELALAMFRHYRMNGDERFLREVALPVMLGAAEFYMDCFERGEDGLFHIEGTTAYEGTPPFADTLTDLSAARALLGALLSLPRACLGETERERCRMLLQGLPAPSFTDMEAEESAEGRLLLGIGAGGPVCGAGKVMTVGRDAEGRGVRKNFGDPTRCFYGFPDTEMSPIYPSGTVGLKDRGSALFDTLCNNILLHGEPDSCMHWCMMPLYMARMGMAEELFSYMRSSAETWTVFPNGFCADGPSGREDAELRLRYNEVRAVGTGEKRRYEAYGFRHFDNENMPILAAALNEAVLQSYDGTLRLFPAIPRTESAAFTLYAEGGFRVSAQKQGEVLRAEIRSLRGEPCVLVLPGYLSKQQLGFLKEGRETIRPEITEKNGELYVELAGLLGAGERVEMSSGSPEPMAAAAPNTDCKSCGRRTLGTPRLFWEGECVDSGAELW